MTNTTMAEELVTFINSEANNNPPPVKCRVTKNYDEHHIDVTTEFGDYEHIQCLFSNKVGNIGVLIFLNGDLNDPIALIDNR